MGFRFVIPPVLVLTILTSIFGKSSDPMSYQFHGRFIKAEVLEGSGCYTFQNSAGEMVAFAFDDYNNQKIPYQFFDNNANTNAVYVGSWFKITYETVSEMRGESVEKILVKKIKKIRLVK